MNHLRRSYSLDANATLVQVRAGRGRPAGQHRRGSGHVQLADHGTMQDVPLDQLLRVLRDSYHRLSWRRAEDVGLRRQDRQDLPAVAGGCRRTRAGGNSPLAGPGARTRPCAGQSGHAGRATAAERGRQRHRDALGACAPARVAPRSATDSERRQAGRWRIPRRWSHLRDSRRRRSTSRPHHGEIPGGHVPLRRRRGEVQRERHRPSAKAGPATPEGRGG